MPLEVRKVRLHWADPPLLCAARQFITTLDAGERGCGPRGRRMLRTNLWILWTRCWISTSCTVFYATRTLPLARYYTLNIGARVRSRDQVWAWVCVRRHGGREVL
ncbi:uncharacterized protein SCHCODRAFT_02154475 [Schizophyllum commune H4-8]|uniref:uncharacterized protein n=1 Tax=Schizophyllum commune (strain H4-8 / FGSC 9210) TaxID=578458 RepID=UPI00215F22E2|nr:uncharacterized protein SCHCODRAFT_02154475 [Schizophyllum commune H4-8]KAI5898026.1 hypothetical protein SCHCODRAFT_02154475 [Schizophyllum commune H4-8]